VTTNKHRTGYSASLEVACKGGRHVEFFQIAEGIMVTCRHEVNRGRCEALVARIAKGESDTPKASSPSPTPAPEAVPAAAPVPPATPEAPAPTETPPAQEAPAAPEAPAATP
jgi:hypothetical protein